MGSRLDSVEEGKASYAHLLGKLDETIVVMRGVTEHLAKAGAVVVIVDQQASDDRHILQIMTYRK